MGDAATASLTTDEDLLLKEFFAEVSEVERDNEVIRYFFFLCYLSLFCIPFDGGGKNYLFWLALDHGFRFISCGFP